MLKPIILFLLLIGFYNVVDAQFRTKKTFSSHAVLQRNAVIPITGWGAPGEKVKVIFNRKEYPGTADQQGRWTIDIPPTPAGGPHTIEIKSADNGLTYKDIYFGDVWLCSGQSNMEWVLQNTENAEEEISRAKDGKIRHFKVPHANELKPAQELPGGEWQVLSPETAGQFTAVGYYFAQSIRAHNDVPIGLLNSSWGGSRIEPWMNNQVLSKKHPEYSLKSYQKKNNIDLEGRKKALQDKFPGVDENDQGMDDQMPKWVNNKEAEKWKKIDPSELWENQGYDGLDGVIYYRTYFEADEDIDLHLGTIDDSDMTWVNGQLVGQTNGYNVHRIYRVSEDKLRDGKNELLIRIHDTGGGGGMYTSKFATGIGDKALTDFDWEMRVGALQVNNLSNQIPNLIYNAMIHPIIDFPIKGIIWYQGESNAGNLESAYDYRYLLKSLIGQWRTEWNNPELPFYYVQLANFRQPMKEPGTDAWAVIRESMTEVLELPNTGQAVIIDIGEANDIHPRNKKDVGYRLALPARNQVYDEDVVPGSPMYADHQVVGNHMLIEFQQVGDGLMVKDRYGYVKGFSIAGEDGQYVWAKAKLENGKVMVWSEKVTNPVSVRYAWEINPFDANLFSLDGLPVTPFRTDDQK
ncbi:sialate O-acetylesterase [Portibacter marinus]|uniref:sialate O-acetylesterase n=1 Tax=Portibacter marinus TaxID=2898660 RepID=UPI001F408EA9|nr:sialate O-acetylesterase [Portibacter marinus]